MQSSICFIINENLLFLNFIKTIRAGNPVRKFFLMANNYRKILFFAVAVLFTAKGLCAFPHLFQDSLLYDTTNPGYYDSLGKINFRQGAFRKAIRYFEKSFSLKKAVSDSLGMADSYEAMSRAYQSLGAYKKAIAYQLKASKLRAEVLNPYYQKVEALFAKGDDSLNLTRLYYRFGLYLARKGQKKRGIDYFREALNLARAMHYDKAISTIANDLGGEYWDLGEQELSTIFYKESLAAAVRIGDSNRMAAVYLNLGGNYKEQGHLEAGMEQMLKALKIKEALADSSRLSFYYIQAAEIAKASRNWKKWKEYVQKASRVKNRDHCATAMDKALIYENLGAIAEQEMHDKAALRYYDTLMDISRKINFINGIKVALNNRASLYREMGQPKKALQLLKAADKYYTQNPYYDIAGNNAKAALYLQTGQYKKALFLLKKNIASRYLNNYAWQKLKTLQLLYKVNTELADYPEAFRWNDSLVRLQNRLQDITVRGKIAELETKYETEKSKHTIGMLKAKNEIYNQQIRFAILLIVVLIVAIIFGIFAARMNKLKAEFRENKLQQQLLLSQMNPHFIFNALASIQEMIRNNKTKEASFYLGKFASIARLVLEYSREDSIPLESEVEMLHSYIELERLRSGNRFSYQINIPDDLETEFIRIPSMLIQPFVENAIKHGLREKKEKGTLHLSFEDLGDVLKVVIEDNGVGIEHAPATKKRHRSMAMEIFEMRRQLLQKRFKKKLIVRFVDLSREGKTGTRVVIHLPIL